MSYLPKFARVIAFAGIHMLTPAWGQSHDASMGGTALAMTEIAKGELKRGDRLMAEATPPAPWHSGPPDRCDGPPLRPGPKFHAGEASRQHLGPGRLATMLNATETEIGIRSNQLDAWRDFTDALIATMMPPWLQPGAQSGAPGAAAGAQTNEPFSPVQRLAENAIRRGQYRGRSGKGHRCHEKQAPPRAADEVRHHRGGPPRPPGTPWTAFRSAASRGRSATGRWTRRSRRRDPASDTIGAVEEGAVR